MINKALLLLLVQQLMRALFTITLLLLLMPTYSDAQDADLHLNARNQITLQKSDYQCSNNYDRTKGYAKCYNVFDGPKHLIKELNMKLHLPDSLKTAANRPYIYYSATYGDYLIGDYQAGKPYNGFFKQDGAALDWMIYSFYQNGQLIEQLYNDQYNTVTAREDTEEAYTTLDARNTFTNGVLTNGIKLSTIEIKGAAAELVNAVKNGKTDFFVVGLFAMHYGEFIRITPEASGYLLQSSLSAHQLHLTFNAQGRRLEVLNSNGKADNTIEYLHHELADQPKLSRQTPQVYIEKNGRLYIEQVKDIQALERETRREEDGNDGSPFLYKMAQSLFTLRPLNKAFFVSMLSEQFQPGGRPDYLGQYQYFEGKPYGIIYTAGTAPNTYNLRTYQAGKLMTDKAYNMQNKTLAEIKAAFKARKK